MSVSSIGAPALGTELLSFLATQLRNEGIKPGSTDGEVTTQTVDGGSITTIGTGKNADIVSETSASGVTLTQVGYVSPVLTQNFLNSLQQALQVSGTFASSGSVAGDGGDNASSPVKSLLAQLADPAAAPDHQALLTSFAVLLQGSGIETASSVSGTLEAFLQNTLPHDSASKQAGNSVNITA